MERTPVAGKEQILARVFEGERISLAYSHNGGDVYIFRENKDGGRGYNSKAIVCVIKQGEKEPLVFRISESVNNEVMTVFTRATVDGMPSRGSKDSDGGLYPFNITLSDDKKTPNTDIMAHAAEVYERFDKEYPDLVQIGKIFRKYVPMSYEKIREQLESMDKKKKEDDLKNIRVADVVRFSEQFKRF